MCGEQLPGGHGRMRGIGSPPRVRGTAFPTSHGSPLMGITPACAGNSSPRPCGAPDTRDHPRVCGEQLCDGDKAQTKRGSPPRVRGTATAINWYQMISRITPACAGNSSSISEIIPSNRDHPRVCGEQSYSMLSTCCHNLSPPRVRGTVVDPMDIQEDARITPACAGNSTSTSAPTIPGRDHPRVCGEQ